MSWITGGGTRGAMLTMQGVPDATMKSALDAIWAANRGNLSSYLGQAVMQDTSVNYGITHCDDEDVPLGLIVGLEGNPTVGYTVTVMVLGYTGLVTLAKGSTGATLGHTAVLVDGSTGDTFQSAATAGNYLVVSEDEPVGSFDALVR